MSTSSTSSFSVPAPLAAIPVAFTEAMLAPMKRVSPSAAKPRPVVESWRRLGVPLSFLPVTPVTREELARAHDVSFVDGVLEGRRVNGFGDTDPLVAASLPWTSGALLSAARHILDTGTPVAAAPCSGFHHARWSGSSGFCTFNGLMVTALALLAEGRARRVGILDCDMHYGDGTDEIMGHLGLTDSVRHITVGAEELTPADAERFLSRDLPAHLASLSDCDLVLYQAGADPHIHDPLGGWLTTEQLHRRDRIVFEGLARKGTPVVWNLAGGYQVERDGTIPRVLAIHDNTMRACAAVHLGAHLT